LSEELELVKRSLHEANTLKEVNQKQIASIDALISNVWVIFTLLWDTNTDMGITSNDFQLDKSVILKNESDTSFDADQLASRIESLHTVHREKSLKLACELPAMDTRIHKLNEEVSKLNRQISSLRSDSKSLRTIHITLDAKKECTVEMELIYQVGRASWTPSYDVRVETRDTEGKPAPTKMRIYYYGNIRQQSGEEWSDVDLVLSTAQPRAHGELPELGTLEARFRPPAPTPMMYKAAMPQMCIARAAGPASARYTAESDVDTVNGEFEVEHYSAEKQLLSTNFSIPQKKSIPSDSTEHRVTIAVLELDPLLHYDCVPCKDTNVFLSATAINSSTYPLLRGQASIYLDGAFNTKATMKDIGCGEKFDLAVGVDSSVKVVYKPAHKYKQQVSLLIVWFGTFSRFISPPSDWSNHQVVHPSARTADRGEEQQAR